MRDYQDDIMGVVGYGEEVSSEEIARRIGVIRNCILQDLYQLYVDHRLEREKVVRARGGVSYIYRRPDCVPWSEWPSWCVVSDLPACWIR